MNRTKKINELYKLVETSNKNLDYKTSTQNLQKIIGLLPTNINKYLRELGEIYEKQQMFKEAAESYIKVLETEKTDIPTIGVLTNQIGMCFYNIKELRLAAKYFNQVLKMKEIAELFSVSFETISSINNGITWSWVIDPNFIKAKRISNRKLSETDVKNIRELLSQKISYRKIASQFNVSVACIQKIKNGKTFILK